MLNLFFIMSFFFYSTGLIFSLLSFFLMKNSIIVFFEWNLVFSFFKISFPILLDFKSSLFMGMVMLISASIMVYSEFYMEKEIYKIRFFFLMKLFVFSMIFLIICPNLICMLVGWDGLGLVSYCLVIFYQNFKSFSAGMLTALTNRVGDVFILSSIGLFLNFGSFNFLNFICKDLNFWLILMFMIASITKSAQIPFSSWLPAAMAAPTPVSSLVHSSTLVTAGVYILIRFSYYLKNLYLNNFLLILGLMTMIMSGINGVLEFDLKKIIALSTLSQLGFMISTLCMGMENLSFFHLLTHACFKALLFMCSGILIHEFLENQDIRNLGMLSKNYSIVICLFNVANLSLSGFPFLSGFFSKDLILEILILKNTSLFIFFLFMFGTFLTVLYSFRLMFFLIFKKGFFFNSISSNLNFFYIEKSMILLYFFSIMLGYNLSKLMFFPFNFIILPYFLKGLVSLICLLSFFMSLMFSKWYKIFFMKKMILFFSCMWFLNFLKTDFLKKSVFISSNLFLKLTDVFSENLFGFKSMLNLFLYNNFLNIMFKKLIFLIFYSFFILFFLFFVTV